MEVPWLEFITDCQKAWEEVVSTPSFIRNARRIDLFSFGDLERGSANQTNKQANKQTNKILYGRRTYSFSWFINARYLTVLFNDVGVLFYGQMSRKSLSNLDGRTKVDSHGNA